MFTQIKKHLGENLVSLFSYNKLNADYLVIVLKKSDYRALFDSRNLLREHNLIIMTEKDFSEGYDVFPLEFIDMQSSYKQIDGKDLLKNIKLNKNHLRDQLERELRSKRIHLKNQFIEGKEKEFLQKIIPTLTPIIKGLLYYKKKEFTNQIDNNLSKLQEVYKIDTVFLKKIAKISAKGGKISKESYLEKIEQIDLFLTDSVNHIN